MHISRRQLLAISAAAAAVGVIGVGGLGVRWWDQPPSSPLQRLSDEEASIIRAIAGAAFPATDSIPLDGAEADLDRFFDQLLQHIPETPQKLLKLLLHGLDGSTVLTNGASFTALTRADRARVFQGWVHHDLAEARNAIQSLVLLIGMGWSIHPAVAPTMEQYHSCGYGI
jgi:hypothetical protein